MMGYGDKTFLKLNDLRAEIRKLEEDYKKTQRPDVKRALERAKEEVKELEEMLARVEEGPHPELWWVKE